MQGEMQYPQQIDAPNYNVAHYHPPPPPVSDSHRCDMESSLLTATLCIVSGGSKCAHASGRWRCRSCPSTSHTLLLQYVEPFFSTDISDQIIWCRRSKIITMAFMAYGAHLPAADPPEAFPGVQPHAAPPADMPPANGLRNLAGRFLNNPDTLVNMLRIDLALVVVSWCGLSSNWQIFSVRRRVPKCDDPHHHPQLFEFGERKKEE
jgi:hypothetical protein